MSTGDTRNYVDWDDEWAGLKARVEALERWFSDYGFTPAPAEGECDCRGWTLCPDHAPPEAGKRMYVCMVCYQAVEDIYKTPGDHMHLGEPSNVWMAVVPAALLDAREELWAGRDRRQDERLAAAEARNDEQALTIKILREEARAAEAREKGLLRILELDGWSEEQIRTALAPEKP